MSWNCPTSPIVTNPITWGEIKYWLRIDDDEKAERDGLLGVASNMLAWAEDITGSTLSRRTRTVVHYDGSDAYEVPYGPVNAITSVTDANGAAVAYTLRQAGLLACVCVPGVCAMPLTITYDAGDTELHGTVKRAILIAVETMHRNRGGEVDLSGVERILATRNRNVGIA